MSALGDVLFGIIDLVADLWPFGSSTGETQKQKPGGINGHTQARDFVRWVQSNAHDVTAVVIAYESKWKWFANAEWRELVTGRVLDTGLFHKVEFLPPCSLDNEWSFGAYLKEGPTVKHARLDMRM